MTTSKIHLHVENRDGLGRVFEADKKRVREVDMGFGDGDLDELDLGG